MRITKTGLQIILKVQIIANHFIRCKSLKAANHSGDHDSDGRDDCDDDQDERDDC